MTHNIIPFSLILLLISGCVDQMPSPIEYNHNSHANSRKHSNEISHNTQSDGEVVSHQLESKNEDSEKVTGVLKEHKDILHEETILPEPKEDNSTIIYHEVQEGETLEIIAKSYDQTLKEIAHLNNLSTPYHLDEFQTIKIKVNKDVLNNKSKQAVKSIEQKINPTMPVTGDIIVKFGEQTANGKSRGINIIAKEGSDIKSVAEGEVMFSGNSEKFGNLIIVKSNNNTYFAYGHMQDLILEKGSKVSQGEVIGRVGHTGKVKDSQLHFAVKEGKTPVNPEKYLQN